jgi:hypothetical protein
MAWILTATGLLACVVALVVGAQVYGDGAARARAEAVERTPVQAVVLEQPRTSVAAYAGIRSPRAVRLSVAVRYRAPNGVERDGAARVSGTPVPGTSVPIWVDRDGAVATAPTSHSVAVQAAVLSACTLGGIALLLLVGLWQLVCSGISRLNAVAWERDWARVEPMWTGRIGRGSPGDPW